MSNPEFNVWHLLIGGLGGVAKQVNDLLTAAGKPQIKWEDGIKFGCGAFVGGFVGLIAGSLAMVHTPEYTTAIAGLAGFIGPQVLFFAWDVIKGMAAKSSEKKP